MHQDHSRSQTFVSSCLCTIIHSIHSPFPSWTAGEGAATSAGGIPLTARQAEAGMGVQAAGTDAEAGGKGENEDKYVISIKETAKFVVGLGDRVSPTDIEEGMRVGVDRNKYQIQIPLPPSIDPSVTMMQVEEKPDVTYSEVGGCKEQIEKLREVVELPLLHVSSSVILT